MFHNGVYRQKVIPDKKKAEKLKRKKVDIREYQPFLLTNTIHILYYATIYLLSLFLLVFYRLASKKTDLE